MNQLQYSEPWQIVCHLAVITILLIGTIWCAKKTFKDE